MKPRQSARVFWLFGLSGAGKSTLGEALAGELRRQGHPILILDGDRLRRGLCQGLGFSTADRTENLRRAAETARLALESELSVVASFITPRESHRQLIGEIIGRERVSLVHVSASLAICARRDVKGLYAGAQAGAVNRLTGVSDPFETPALVDFIVDTSEDPPATSASRLVAFALGQLSS